MNGFMITLYLVGEDEDDAQGNFPFDSLESAAACALGNDGAKIYSVDAFIDFSSIQEV